MKIGICLIGVSFSDRGVYRDFRTTYENFFDTIYNPLAENHDVSLYTTTYSVGLDKEFLDAYKPTKNQFVTTTNSRITYIKGLELIENEDLDFVITTRYDIRFFKKITEINIDFTKFNFLFKDLNNWNDDRKLVNDCFFAFPYKYLFPYEKAALKAHVELEGSGVTFLLHNVYHHVINAIGIQNTHFIFDKEESSVENHLYRLERKPHMNFR